MRQRCAIKVHGVVQGVGFRPFVHALACQLQLGGFVRNQAGELLIEVEGDADSLDRFYMELTCRPPPLARIERISRRRIAVVGELRFRIALSSDSGHAADVFISPDVATCGDCLAELFDPADRRYGYALINCTNCGPRLTIVTGAPYDRERTTMAPFVMCPACRAEYTDPDNRRFHAQPIACATCGPQLRLLSPSGDLEATTDPLSSLAKALAAGRIAAVKGLGGYHLVCDARSEAAVAELRRRKHRDEKPFAIMVRDLEQARAICQVGALESELLASPRSPIVLLRKRATAIVAAAVAPRNPFLGVLLPYTPLHHLMLKKLDGMPLVMTSGNRSDEPIAYQDENARQRLGDLVDLLLVHNRPIHVRCDDSVTRIVDGRELPVRRSRGYAPQPVKLPAPCPHPILAVGGQLKSTFALGRDEQAVMSHHLGDLDHFQAYQAFERDIELYQQLFRIRPDCIAHDAHPDYASTHYGKRRAAREKLRLLPVQHHHAHMASCMAEHGLAGPVIGVIFDGTGFGTDGAIWGGEFLVGDYRGFHRAAHLRYVGMPGGERAVREPWRMAAAHLADAGLGMDLLRLRVLPVALRTVETMLARGLNTPKTSSAGRLFDAVASMIAVHDRVTYEAQAAMQLEWLAAESSPHGIYPFQLDPHRELEPPHEVHPLVGHSSAPLGARLWPQLGERPAVPQPAPFTIDTRPLVRAIAGDAQRHVPPPIIARRFHDTMAEIVSVACRRIAQATGICTVVLSGGVFLNALLTCEVVARLDHDRLQVYRHQLVPPNDGGLCLGQVAIAAAIINL